MTQLFAQPYDISANGFYFESYDEYKHKAASLRNAYGEIVEEFEIQFIDGEDLDCAIFQALSIYQGEIEHYLNAVDEWDEQQKIAIILAVSEAGYSFDFTGSTPEDFDIEIYELDSMKELAEQFVDDGCFGEIPEHLASYIDYEAIAYDLSMDYAEAVIAGRKYIYRV